MTYNATSGQGYTYDQENRITSLSGYGYTYDSDGNRVIKTTTATPATGTLYWYMTPGIVAESDLSGAIKSEYVFFDGERVARRDTNSGVFYYFSDHLKTAAVQTDASGNIQDESDFYPWGGELQFTNSNDNHYKFTGKERDPESGLDYFGARYNSSSLGRFLSADPVGGSSRDPQSLNRYSYVQNSPLNGTDPTGMTLRRRRNAVSSQPEQRRNAHSKRDWKECKVAKMPQFENTVRHLRRVISVFKIQKQRLRS